MLRHQDSSTGQCVCVTGDGRYSTAFMVLSNMVLQPDHTLYLNLLRFISFPALHATLYTFLPYQNLTISSKAFDARSSTKMFSDVYAVFSHLFSSYHILLHEKLFGRLCENAAFHVTPFDWPCLVLAFTVSLCLLLAGIEIMYSPLAHILGRDGEAYHYQQQQYQMAKKRRGDAKYPDRKAEARKRTLSEDYGGIFIYILVVGHLLLALLSPTFIGATCCLAFSLPFAGQPQSPTQRIAPSFQENAVAILLNTPVAHFARRLMVTPQAASIYLHRAWFGGLWAVCSVLPALLLLAAQISIILQTHHNNIDRAQEEALSHPRITPPNANPIDLKFALSYVLKVQVSSERSINGNHHSPLTASLQTTPTARNLQQIPANPKHFPQRQNLRSRC